MTLDPIEMRHAARNMLAELGFPALLVLRDAIAIFRGEGRRIEPAVPRFGLEQFCRFGCIDIRLEEKVHIPRQADHRFRGKATTESRASRPPIPG